MSRPRADDPLLPVTLRLPRSLQAQLRAQAAAAGVTLSDVVRSRFDAAEAKPLGKPTPRRRPPKLASVSGLDPLVARTVVAMGNNMNQIARQLNAQAKGAPEVLTAVEVLARMTSIDRSLGKLISTKKEADDAH
jgi:hypothetical protein